MELKVSVLFTLNFSLFLFTNGQEIDSANKLSFLAVGDFGGLPFSPFSTPTQTRVAASIGKIADEAAARFVVGLGDNFYYSGVRSVDDPRFQQTFENVFTAPALHRTTWYMIAGNHDYIGNVSAQVAYTSRSRRWKFPYFYYTIVEKIPGTSMTVQLVMIDTVLLCFKRPRKREATSHSNQLKWIESTLRASRADYLIVAGHHPVLSAGIHGNTHCLVSSLKPLLENYDVTAYLSGHDHNQQHIKEDNASVHYFVSGNGNFYSPWMVHKFALPDNTLSLKSFSGSSGGFTLLEATPTALYVTQIDEHGNRLYGAGVKPRQP